MTSYQFSKAEKKKKDSNPKNLSCKKIHFRGENKIKNDSPAT